MLIPLVVVLAAATLTILLVLVVALIKQVARLAGSVKGFHDDLQPILQDLKRDADQAGTRLRSINERQAAMRKER